jgi:hypothetical protein
LLVLYVVVIADLVGAAWLLGYARVRERRNRPGVIAVGLMLVACAAVLLVIHATRPSPAQVRLPTPGEPSGPVGQPA